MVRKYTDAQLLKRVKELGSFKKIPSSYWILGVRSNEDIPNAFDDKFYIFEGERFIMVLSGTTNPGVAILKNYYKFNSVGAAIVAADNWYYDLWIFGKHRGKIDALLQLGNKILVYRDGDKDNKSEELGTPKWGFYGINFHLNSHDINSNQIKGDINGWSAGCQVPNDPKKYRAAMELFKNRREKFTYCLLNEFEP
jgi:hypothetical protein